MIFTELRFVALFVGCWITFYLVPRRYRAAVLTFWGAAFYLIYTGPFFVVIAAAATYNLLLEIPGFTAAMAGIVGLHRADARITTLHLRFP